MAKPSLESCRVDPGDGFQYLSSYQNVSRWKNRNWWKKISKFFSLPISLRVTLKLSLRSRFSAKNHFFVFCRKFGFNLEKLSNHYCQLKKQVKVDPETRSYDFLTKTREKNPRSPNILILGMTLGFHLITYPLLLHAESMCVYMWKPKSHLWIKVKCHFLLKIKSIIQGHTPNMILMWRYA